MAKAKLNKILRIGIIQDGKIVQETLIKAGDPVILGEGAKATFQLPKGSLSTPEVTLFAFQGSQYALRFTDKMKGRVSSGGGVVALNKLASESVVTKLGDVYTLPLTENDRGKVTVDQVTVLFQFVSPPPVQAVKPIQAMDFSARWMDEDDPVFLGFLGLWAALAMVLVVYVHTVEIPPPSLDQMPERFTRILVPEKKKDPPPDPDKGKKEASKAESSKAKAPDEPKTAKDQAKQDEETKERVLNQSKLLTRLIGTKGESGRITDQIAAGPGLADLDAALKGAGAAVSNAAAATRGGTGTEGGLTDIGGPGIIGAGSANVGGGPAVKATVRADSSGTVSEDIADGDCVKKIVTKYSGQLQYCYERRLNAVPDLGGRIEIGWNIGDGGVVGSVYVVANGTGDAELGECVKGKVKRWNFATCADATGDVSWPFAFTTEN